MCWGFLGDPDESKALESPDWMYQTLEPIPGESKIIQRHKDKDNDQDNEHEHEHENENENEQAPIIEALVEPDDDLTADGWDPMSEIPLSEGTGTGTGLDEIEPSDAEPPPVEIQPLDPSIARERGLILWCGTIEPLLGVDEGARHPEGSPKYNRDIASMEAWFAERLWPHEISDEEGRRRLDMAIEQAKLAPTRSTNPMRYLAHYTKKFAESMAHG